MQLEINSLSVLTISVLIFLWNKDDITSESFHFSSFKKNLSNSLVVTSVWKCLLRKTKFRILQLAIPTKYLVDHVAKLKVLPPTSTQTSFISVPCARPHGSSLHFSNPPFSLACLLLSSLFNSWLEIMLVRLDGYSFWHYLT